MYVFIIKTYFYSKYMIEILKYLIIFCRSIMCGDRKKALVKC